MSNNQNYFGVYIVESPSAVDLYHKRFEGEILSRALSLANIPSVHKLVVNKEAFNAALTVGMTDYISLPNALPPVLHISAHGFNDGIQLTSGEIITWDELSNMVAPINKGLNGYLLLCMSSCEGITGCTMAMTDKELPFFGIIGHLGKPTWSDTAIAFASLYHLLAKRYSITDAVKAMQIASGDQGFRELLASNVQTDFLNRLNQAIEKLQANKPEAAAIKEEDALPG
jgi:hypothetical protein